jgi:AcrR family transcriptional regulator
MTRPANPKSNEEILDLAIPLFARSGYAGVSMRDIAPEQRLEDFIHSFTKLMSDDPDFLALLQRELLEGDEARLKLLADQVFKQQFIAMGELASELVPDCDAHMAAISIASLVMYHLETAPIRRFLPDGKAKHNKPDVISRHVTGLLLHGLKGCGK